MRVPLPATPAGLPAHSTDLPEGLGPDCKAPKEKVELKELQKKKVNSIDSGLTGLSGMLNKCVSLNRLSAAGESLLTLPQQASRSQLSSPQLGLPPPSNPRKESGPNSGQLGGGVGWGGISQVPGGKMGEWSGSHLLTPLPGAGLLGAPPSPLSQ